MNKMEESELVMAPRAKQGPPPGLGLGLKKEEKVELVMEGPQAEPGISLVMLPPGLGLEWLWYPLSFIVAEAPVPTTLTDSFHLLKPRPEEVPIVLEAVKDTALDPEWEMELAMAEGDVNLQMAMIGDKLFSLIDCSRSNADLSWRTAWMLLELHLPHEEIMPLLESSQALEQAIGVYSCISQLGCC